MLRSNSKFTYTEHFDVLSLEVDDTIIRTSNILQSVKTRNNNIITSEKEKMGFIGTRNTFYTCLTLEMLSILKG